MKTDVPLPPWLTHFTRTFDQSLDSLFISCKDPSISYNGSAVLQLITGTGTGNFPATGCPHWGPGNRAVLSEAHVMSSAAVMVKLREPKDLTLAKYGWMPFHVPDSFLAGCKCPSIHPLFSTT